MTARRSPAPIDDSAVSQSGGGGTTTATRRGVLSALGSIGLASLGGVVAGRASADSASGSGPSGPDETFPDREALESYVDEVVGPRIGRDTPGATVAVVDGADVALAKGYGHADAAAGTPVRAAETGFRIGSVGKLVTWTAVMQGVADGRLDLDADVRTYLDDSPVRLPDAPGDGEGEPVTLRHLGTHTAGFATALDPGLVDDPADLSSIQTALVERRPERVRPPGEAVGYSNYGAMLAGHVVAEAFDQPFVEYVDDAVFEPLGATHATFAQPVPDDYPGEVASPHVRDGDAFAVADPLYVDWLPAGSATATATDVAAFASAHLGDGTVGDARILPPDAAATMHRRQFVRHPAVNSWRYGFYEYGPPDAPLIAHSGGTLHFASLLVLAPDRDAAVFVGYNARTGESPAAVVDAILAEYDLVSSDPAPARTIDGRRAREGARTRAERVAGEYRSTVAPNRGPGRIVGLLGRLVVSATGSGRITTETVDGGRRAWVEVAPYVYREVDGTDVVAFDVAGDGGPTAGAGDVAVDATGSAGVGDDPVVAAHVSSRPQQTYLPVRPRERRLVVGGAVGVSLAGFALSTAGWAGLGAWRRWRRWRTADDTSDDEERGAPGLVDGPAEGSSAPIDSTRASSTPGAGADRDGEGST